MPIKMTVDDSRAFAITGRLAENVHREFAASIGKITNKILDDARARAVAHFHSVGDDPGGYLLGFKGGVKETPQSVVGYVRNAHNIAHLLEFGFTISDLLIDSAGAMQFLMGADEVYRRAVHRPQTRVRAYPALFPAFEDHKSEIIDAAEQAAASATKI